MAQWQANKSHRDMSGNKLALRAAAQNANDLPEVESWANPNLVKMAGAKTLLPGVEIYATGWQTALRRDPVIKSFEFDWEVTSPPVISIPVKSPRVKVLGFAFPESANWESFARKAEKRQKPDSGSKLARKRRPKPKQPGAAKKSKGRTRVLPPRDVIKLEDRLYYLLQPPLESIAATESLRFPFEPFPYQFEGVAFLYSRFAGILADEMGLGKTMQAITTIRMLLCSSEVRNVLLICPKPLVSNWKKEFELWAPEIPISIVHGNSSRREWQWAQTADVPVTIANYELVLRDELVVTDEDRHFDLVVLDEAQRIKNKSSSTSRVIRRIPRTRSWALTGTPVENSCEDLVGIFEFLSPGYLYTGLEPARMGEMVGDYILRRTKAMVMTDMPPCMNRDAEIALSPEQWDQYQVAENDGVIKLNKMGDALTIQHVFELVLRLKQICNFDPLTGASAKLDRLEADLEEVAASGKKAIVFSQWVKTLEKIAERLERFNPLQYHGRIPSNKRDPILERFKEDEDCSVILMSYGAGAVGLNLQFCEYVFLFDRWWNPAIEDQAINRAHRIGAKGAVTVTRMISTGTIEERIHQVLEEKRELFDMILSQAKGPAKSGLSQEDIFGLFQLKMPGSGDDLIGQVA